MRHAGLVGGFQGAAMSRTSVAYQWPGQGLHGRGRSLPGVTVELTKTKVELTKTNLRELEAV